MTIGEKFNVLAKDLESNNLIKILHLENSIDTTDSRVIKATFDSFKRSVEFDYFSYFNQFYEIFGCFEIAWQIQVNPNYQVNGEICLVNFMDIFLKQSKLYYNEMPKDKIELLKLLKPFDDHPIQGDGRLCTFRFMPNGEPPEIWFFDNGDVFKVNLTLEEYCEHLLKTKGFIGWQFLFCDLPNDYIYLKLRLEMIKKSLDILPSIFKNTDFSIYLELYKSKFKQI